MQSDLSGYLPSSSQRIEHECAKDTIYFKKSTECNWNFAEVNDRRKPWRNNHSTYFAYVFLPNLNPFVYFRSQRKITYKWSNGTE